MNYKVVFRTIGQIMLVLGLLLMLPLIVSLYYRERNIYLAFIIPIILLLIIGTLLTKLLKPKDKSVFSKEAFIIVSLSWIVISVWGALPFIISGAIPNFFNAFFETVSGFTTTGSTILNDIESISNGLLFWRSFTNWIGGMGILVFVLAFIPNLDSQSLYILKAESPGPQVGKLVSKLKLTAQILYIIYIVLTLITILLLLIGKMPFFDSVTTALSLAGTGGFSIKNASIMAYNSAYLEVVIGILMIVFGINFNIFYLILIGQVSKALFSEELRWYLGIIVSAVIIITIDLYKIYANMGTSLRLSFFQVSSIITTTGFSSFDFNTWPSLSKWVLILLMLTGACAGSTAGGIKVSRIAILFKSFIMEIRNSIHPHQVNTITFEKQPVDPSVIRSISAFIGLLFFMIIIGTLVVSINGEDLLTSLTSVITCISNVGPGLGKVGPTGNFSSYSNFTKIFLSFLMLSGRLELFPMLILFYPKTWKDL